jgi:hypothetical protein
MQVAADLLYFGLKFDNRIDQLHGFSGFHRKAFLVIACCFAASWRRQYDDPQRGRQDYILLLRRRAGIGRDQDQQAVMLPFLSWVSSAHRRAWLK